MNYFNTIPMLDTWKNANKVKSSLKRGFAMAIVENSCDVAAYVVKECERKNLFLNFGKLQKLMFCIYGAVLATFNQKFIDDEPVATDWGPIFPKLYKYTTKEYLADGVIGYYNFRAENVQEKLDHQLLNVVDDVISKFGALSLKDITNWCFKRGSPWFIATNGGNATEVKIPDDVIANYFKNIITKKGINLD